MNPLALVQPNCKYPPQALGAAYEALGELEEKFEVLSTIFKGLKLKAFDNVDKFFTISIY